MTKPEPQGERVQIIRRAGLALFGDRWQSELARALGVNDRTVRRWSAGEEEPRPGVCADLLQLVAERERELRDLGRALAPLAVPGARVEWSTALAAERARILKARAGNKKP